MSTVVGTLTPSHAGPQPPRITTSDIWAQFKIDIAGKEVQTAETSSHSWLANQLGHVCLGIILGTWMSVALSRGLLLVVDWFNLPVSWALPFPWDNIAGSVLATVGVAWWEWRAYRKEVREAAGGFPLDRKLLRDNAITAASYMALGVAFALAFRYFAFGPHDRLLGVPSVIWCAACFLALAFIAVLAALPWLRQKIVWQKAALPYLFRLADAQPATTDDANTLQALIDSRPPPDYPARQIVIGGPIGSGRTEIGAGIGTEFAFRNVSVRYLSLATLLEFATRSDNPHFFDDIGPANLVYWPWTRAQVVIVDDIGPVLTGNAQSRLREFVEILRTQLDGVQTVLQQCHTVWVIGDAAGDGTIVADDDLLDRYAREINDYCARRGNARQKAVVVQLEPGDPRAIPKVPRARVRCT